MKPSVKVFRYLAALVPLLGLALAGCGGLLGSVEGTGLGEDGVTPPPSRLQFTATGKAFVEHVVTTRVEANDFLVRNGTVNILRRTGTGPDDAVLVVSGTTDANGNFSVAVDVENPTTADLQDDLWLIQVIGDITIGNQTRRVALLRPFVPSVSATFTNVEVNVASALVMARVSLFGQEPPALVVSNLLGLIQVVGFRVRQGTNGGNQVGLSLVVIGAQLTPVQAQATIIRAILPIALIVVPAPHTQTIIHSQ
ncbi:MAG: hypothetical protein HY321_14665 [Armatimonadetes bacterium]|nr:hypothetical protein [Armatimonadota bacterium]